MTAPAKSTCCKRLNRAVVANAVVWAAVMMGTSLVIARLGDAQAFAVNMLLVAGWFATHLNIQRIK